MIEQKALCESVSLYILLLAWCVPGQLRARLILAEALPIKARLRFMNLLEMRNGGLRRFAHLFDHPDMWTTKDNNCF